MNTKSKAAVRLELKGALLASVENWRRSQSKIPPRAEAVRQLLKRALTALSHQANDAAAA
jgi:hypothetical protein